MTTSVIEKIEASVDLDAVACALSASEPSVNDAADDDGDLGGIAR